MTFANPLHKCSSEALQSSPHSSNRLDMSGSSQLGSDQSRNGSSSSYDAERNGYHFIVPSADGKRVLAITSGQRAKLPSFRSPEEGQECSVLNWENYPCVLLDCIKEELGFDCFIVRPVWKYRDAEFGVEEVVLVLEMKNYNFTLPKHSRWMSRHGTTNFEWGELRSGMQVHRVINRFFTDSATPSNPGRRPSWRFPGWFRDTEQWVEAQLKENNYGKPIEPFRQITHTFKATVFNCSWSKRGLDSAASERKADAFFIKTSVDVFREAQITSAIANFAEGSVPEVIAVDEQRNVFIQRDVGACNPRRLRFSALIDTLGELQVNSMAHLQELQDEGMEVLDTEWLLRNISALLNHPTLDMIDDDETLSDLGWLRSRVGSIEDLCCQLMRLGIPNTLVHGDLHHLNVGGQVSVPDGKYRIFDWEWAFIGNPFQDFETLYRNSHEYGIEEDHARGLYSKFWDSILSMEEVDRAVDLTGALSLPILLYRWQQLFDHTEQIGADRPLGEMAEILREFRANVEELLEESLDES